MLDGEVLDVDHLRLIRKGDAPPPSAPRGAGMDNHHVDDAGCHCVGESPR